MFLTRMALDLNRPETAELLKDRERLRENVSRLFGAQSNGVLWRIDEQWHRTWLILYSSTRPPMEGLHSRYGLLGAFPSWDTFSLLDEEDEMVAGSVWDFQLVACPRPMCPDAECGDMDRAALVSWLDETAAASGFEVLHCGDITSGRQRVGNQTMVVGAWTGVLRVTDGDRFRPACIAGFGEEKQYGVGLMTTQPRYYYQE